MKKWILPCFFFLFGGSVYFLLEMAARRFSHWSMFLAGGACFLLVDWANRRLGKKTPLWVRCTVGACIITAVEFIAGCCVNLWAGWQIWDYSDFKYQFMGQICLRYTAIWFFLSAPIIWLSGFFRRQWTQLIANSYRLKGD